MKSLDGRQMYKPRPAPLLQMQRRIPIRPFLLRKPKPALRKPSALSKPKCLKAPPPMVRKTINTAKPPLNTRQSTSILIRPPTFSSHIVKPETQGLGRSNVISVEPTFSANNHSENNVHSIQTRKNKAASRKRHRTEEDEDFQPQPTKKRARRSIGQANTKPKVFQPQSSVDKKTKKIINRKAVEIDENFKPTWRDESEIIIPNIFEISPEDWPTTPEHTTEEDVSNEAYYKRHYRAEHRERLFYRDLQKWRLQDQQQQAEREMEKEINKLDPKKDTLDIKVEVLQRPRGPWLYPLPKAFRIITPLNIVGLHMFNYDNIPGHWSQPHYLIQSIRRGEKVNIPAKAFGGGKNIAALRQQHLSENYSR